MIPPRVCSRCKGIRTAHGIIGGEKSCPACVSVYHKTLGNKQAATPVAPPSAFRSPVPAAAKPSKPTLILDISPHDVLAGRGRYATSRQGNRYYRQLLEEHCEAYARCTSMPAKTEFTRAIVQQVKQTGRFLKTVDGIDGAFVEMSDSKARVKVGQDLRYQQMNKDKKSIQRQMDPSPAELGRPTHDHVGLQRSTPASSKLQKKSLDAASQDFSHGCHAIFSRPSTRAGEETVPWEGEINFDRGLIPISMSNSFADEADSAFDPSKILRTLNSEFTLDADEQQDEESVVVNPSDADNKPHSRATQSPLYSNTEGVFSKFGTS